MCSGRGGKLLEVFVSREAGGAAVHATCTGKKTCGARGGAAKHHYKKTRFCQLILPTAYVVAKYTD